MASRDAIGQVERRHCLANKEVWGHAASQLEDKRVAVGGWEKLIEGRKTIKRERARGGEVAAMLTAGNAERFNENAPEEVGSIRPLAENSSDSEKQGLPIATKNTLIREVFECD